MQAIEERHRKKAILAALVFSIFATVAHAQNIPLANVSGGYSTLEVVKGSGLPAEGGSSSVALNFNNWLGAVGPGLAAGTYTFGPRFSYRRWGRITPFAQVLLGGVRYADNGLVFGSGGGADMALDHAGRFALRP